MTNHDHTHEDHLDPTHEITLEVVKERAKKGIIILTGRSFFLQALSLVAWFGLTILLDETQTGAFLVVTAVVSFFRYFSDVGLAASLIQKKDKLTREDLTTTFAIQQFLVVCVLAIIAILTPTFTKYYNLNEESIWLLYSLGAGFFFASLKTIPSILLERKLDFQKLVLIDLVENILYNSTAVILAYLGFGISSFTYAILIRGFVGVILIYILHPWRPGFSFSLPSIKGLLKFGVPYQLNTFLATFKDDGMTAVLGGILGLGGVGYLGWAQKLVQIPLRFFMDNVTKVTFPAFSRMQDNVAELSRTLTRSIFFICFLVFPTVVGISLLVPHVIVIVPQYSKWEPALLPLSILTINVMFAAATTQLTNLLNAIGKIKTTFKLMVMWTALTWIFVPYLAINYGVSGAAIGYAVVGSSSIVAIILVKKIVQFSIRDSIGVPLAATVFMGIFVYFARTLFAPSLFSLLFLFILGVSAYIFAIYLIVGKSIFIDAKQSFATLFKK